MAQIFEFPQERTAKGRKITLLDEINSAKKVLFNLEQERKRLESNRYSAEKKSPDKVDSIEVEINSLIKRIEQAEERLRLKQKELREF